MDNFNPIQFINRLASNYLSAQNQNASAARETQGQSAANQLNYNQPETQPRSMPMFIDQTVMQNFKMETLNFEQRASYIKDLMNLPQEFKDFLNELSKLYAQNPELASKNLPNKLQFDAIAKLLAQNSDVATQKLMQVIANLSRAGVSDIAQFKSMMNIIGASVAAFSADNSQAVKSLILLYLPWLPLNASKNEHLDFELNFFDSNDPENPLGGDSIETVSILIKTQNYGNISALLEMSRDLKISVSLNCTEEFPSAMFTKLFNEKTKEEGLTTQVAAQSKKQSAATQENTDKPSVKMTTESAISSQLLLASYSLIRLVIEIDKAKPLVHKEDELLPQ